MNSVHLMGRIGQDPVAKSVNGKTVLNFSIATKDRIGKTSTWHNIVAWEKKAELIQQYCKKGDQIIIVGYIQNKSWEQNGEKKYRSEVVVDTVEFVSSGKSEPEVTEPLNKTDDLPF